MNQRSRSWFRRYGALFCQHGAVSFAVDSFLRIAQYNANNGGPVVSCGMDIYDPEKDNSFDDVFFRADSRMYEYKKSLKHV